MRHRIDPELTRRARELRNNPTPTEPVVWHCIARYRPAFTRQFVMPPFIVDLACRKAKLGIEFDGSQHAVQVEADDRRTAFLQHQGWRIIRLWNSDVLANLEWAVLHILAEAAECLGGTHPASGEQRSALFRLCRGHSRPDAPLPFREERSSASRQD